MTIAKMTTTQTYVRKLIALSSVPCVLDEAKQDGELQLPLMLFLYTEFITVGSLG